jgi:hypothetical protein
MTKLIAIVVVLLASPALAKAADSCPVPGTMEQWRTDYCTSQVGANAIAMKSCLDKERRLLFRSACTAKLHYKRAMCELTVGGSGSSSVESCVQDPLFHGNTVRGGHEA